VVKVEVDPREVEALIDRGYIDPKDRDDLEVLAAAVTAFFSDAPDRQAIGIDHRMIRLLSTIRYFMTATP
jgi:hypothetical protein